MHLNPLWPNESVQQMLCTSIALPVSTAIFPALNTPVVWNVISLPGISELRYYLSHNSAETHATRTPHFGMDFIEPIANMPAVGDTRGLVRDTRGLAHHPSNDRSEFRVNEWVNLRVNALGQKIQLEANY